MDNIYIGTHKNLHAHTKLFYISFNISNNNIIATYLARTQWNRKTETDVGTNCDVIIIRRIVNYVK